MGYNVNWLAFARIFLPWFMRKDKWKGLMDTLLTPFVAFHNDFIANRNRVRYNMAFNGQTMNLEHVLNDRWDNSLRGIYIDTVPSIVGLYIYNKPEMKPKVYVYRKWDAMHNYAVGEYAQYDTGVYVCTTAHTNVTPASPSPYWQFHRGRVVIVNKAEVYAQDDFIVYVPSWVVFDSNEMKTLINYYKIAGKQYSIHIY